MKRFALVLLAVGLAGALYLLSSTSGSTEALPAGEGETTATDGRPADEIPATGSNAGEQRPDESSSPEREAIGDHKIAIRGRLVDAKGNPRADVAVELRNGKSTASPFRYTPSNKPAVRPTAVTKTDSDGRFTLRSKPGEAGYLTLAHPDFVWKSRPPRFEPSDTDLRLGDLTVVVGAILRGFVSTEDGVPLAGAKVTTMSYESGQNAPRQATTDTRGAFELRGLKAGQSYITARHEGYRSRHVPRVLEQGKTHEDFKIQLRLGQAISGIVVDDRQKPIQGARVNVSGQTKQDADGSYEYGQGSATTDERGAFTARGLGNGPYTVSASAKGHKGNSEKKVAESRTDVRIVLVRYATITGRLLDEKDRPIAGSRVRASKTPPGEKKPQADMLMDTSIMLSGGAVFSSHARHQAGVKTGDDGSFEITNVEGGTVWLIASGAHEEAAHGPMRVRVGEVVEGLEIRAVRGAIAAVRVLDPDGEPLRGVRVSLAPATKATPGKAKSVYTDKDGRCELAGVKPGAYELRASHSDWVAPPPQPIEMPKKGTVDSELRMGAGGHIALRVLDHNGDPVAEQRFRVMPKVVGAKPAKAQNSQALLASPWSHSAVMQRGPSGTVTGRTDASGRAMVGPLPPGEHVAVLLSGGRTQGMVVFYGQWGGGSSGTEIGPRVPVEIVAKQSVDLELTRPQMADLTGTIQDAHGLVSGAVVTLAPEAGSSSGVSINAYNQTRRGRTDADGNYSFEGLMPGTYNLVIQPKGNTLSYREKVSIDGATAHRHDVYLTYGTVELRLTLAGKPLSGVKLSLRAKARTTTTFLAAPGPVPHSTTDAAGVLRFEHVPPGEYTVRIQGKKFVQPEIDPLRVIAGETVQRELAVALAANLTLDVVADADGMPVRAWQLRVQHVDAAKPTTSWRHGRKSTLGSLKPGRYTVQARKLANGTPGARTGPWTAPQTIDVTAGKSVTLKLRLL